MLALAYATTKSKKEADKTAKTPVEERLTACDQKYLNWIKEAVG